MIVLIDIRKIEVANERFNNNFPFRYLCIAMADRQKNIPAIVKRVVHEIDPQAQVYLFGSRARGDSRAESDWDFLILTSKPVSEQYKTELREKILEIELETNQVIQTLIQNSQRWDDFELSVRN